MDYKKIIANMTLEEKALQLSQVAAADIIQDADAVVTGISHSGVPQEHLGELGSALNFSGIEAAEKIRSASFAKKNRYYLCRTWFTVIKLCIR